MGICLFSSELSVGSSLRWLLTDHASHLLVRRNDGGRRYFYRQWTLRIRQFVVRVLLEVAVEGHLQRKEAGSELYSYNTGTVIPYYALY